MDLERESKDNKWIFSNRSHKEEEEKKMEEDDENIMDEIAMLLNSDEQKKKAQPEVPLLAEKAVSMREEISDFDMTSVI